MGHQAAPPMTIVDLPRDVLSCIVQHIQQHAWQHDQTPNDVAALRSVCRSLCNAVDLVATHAAFHANVGVAELRSTISRCTGLSTVKLGGLHPEAAGPTSEALLALAQLRALDMPMFDGMQLEDWPHLSRLTHLVLRRTADSHSGTILAVLPQLTALRSLELANSHCHLLPAALERFVRLQQLTHLDLGHTDHVTALAPQLPNLQSLTMRLSHPTPTAASLSGLSSLLPLTRLRRLSLDANLSRVKRAKLTLCCDGTVSPHIVRTLGDACRKPPGQYAVLPLQAVCHLAALQGVSRQASLQLVSGPPDATFRQPKHDDLSRAVSPCNTLQELRLHSCEVTADVLAELTAAAGRLRVLHLAQCRGALAPLLQAAGVAEDVSLLGAQGGGELLAALKPAARTLTALNTTNMSVQLLAPDAEHLVALTGLTKLHYGHRDGAAAAFGAIPKLTRLRELNLEYASDFDAAQLASLSTLHGLTSLTGWNANVAGSWLNALAAARVPLRELRLFGSVAPGCGAEAAIGRLTRLTSLYLSVDTPLPGETSHTEQQMQHGVKSDQLAQLQLQLLGCSGAACTAGGGSAAAGNTGLQDLTLECTGRLSDNEVTAAAVALPDLRRLDIVGYWSKNGLGVPGLSGAGLAAYSACQRLRDISLNHCSDLVGKHLLEQLPHIKSLASLMLDDCPRVGSSDTEDLQAAFHARHGRHLQVETYF